MANLRERSLSVIMPTYRRARSGLLERAINSVLSQTFDDFEFIIIDDGSSDGTYDIVRRFAAADRRIKHIRHEKNSGLPALRIDQFIGNSHSEYYTYMFDDDFWYREALEILYSGITAENSIDLVYGEVLYLYRDNQGHVTNRVLGSETEEFSLELLEKGNYISNHAVLHRRSCFLRAGLFDPHILIRRLTDWDLWLRIGRKCRIEHLPHLIGEAGGLLTNDSLGYTAAIDWELAWKYMTIHRDDILVPLAIDQFRVDGLEIFKGALSPEETERAYRIFAQFYEQTGDLEKAAQYERKLEA